MQRATGIVQVFTFKAGLLAGAAHDLRLRFERCDCALDGEALTASIDLGSLRVDGPVRGGVVDADAYDAGRRAEIERAARLEVLRADRFPTAAFTGRAVARAGGHDVRGTLVLAGRDAPLAFTVAEDGSTHRASFELQPSRWGIAPYSALLGTIRVQDRVRIEVVVTTAATGA